MPPVAAAVAAAPTGTSHSEMYCSHCYRRGQFVMPAITVHGLEKRVKARLVEVGTPRLLAARLTRDFLSEKVEERLMRRVTLGVLLGLVIGAADVGLMLPLSLPDKRAALLGAVEAGADRPARVLACRPAPESPLLRDCRASRVEPT